MQIRILSVFLTLGMSLSAFTPLHAQSVLYGSEVSLDDLGSIDRSSGSWTTIGNQGIAGSITGLAYDPNNEILYGCSPNNNSLYTLNKSTGFASLVGATGFDNINGLAYDPNNDILYCTDLNGNALFTVNVNTGVGSLIGTITGASAVEGLAYDPASNTLFGLDDSAETIVILDTSNAVATPLPNGIGASGLWRGLTWDSEDGVLMGTIVNPGTVYRIDPNTGLGTLVGSTLTFVQGLAFEDGNAFRLEITGPCPGTANATVCGATPNAQVAIVYAFGQGNFVVPGGFTCAGTQLGLSSNGIALFGVFPADASGKLTLSGTLPIVSCGNVSVQAVDLSTCNTSNVVDL